MNLGEYEMLNSNFRFMITSVSSCVLMSFILSLALLEKGRGITSVIICTFFAIALAFAYPPQAILGYLILAGLTASFLLEHKFRDFIRFLAVAVSATGIVLAVCYSGGFFQASPKTDSFHQIFSISQLFAWESSSLEFLNIAGTKFATIEAVALGAAWHQKRLRRWLLVLGGVGALFFLFSLAVNNDLIMFRLFYRAYALPWLVFVAIALFSWSLPRIKALSLRLGKKEVFVRRAVLSALVVMLVVGPIVGFAHFAWKQIQRPGSYIETCRWNAYEWLQNNTPKGSVVLAVDWDDVYMIPIFTQNSLLFGHQIIEYRTAQEEVLRYLQAWHILGLPRQDLRELVADSVTTYAGLGNLSFFFASGYAEIRQRPFCTWTHVLAIHPTI